MKLVVDVQCASSEPVPDESDIRDWVSSVLANQQRSGATEISVRLVDASEMSKLNLSYRGKTGPTNVLSFPADLPPDLGLPLLGDIVICAPVVLAEAVEQAKTPAAHWAHMIVHGTLHLLGYDHIEEDEAIVMEALESAILASLDYACPYRANPTQEIASA